MQNVTAQSALVRHCGEKIILLFCILFILKKEKKWLSGGIQLFMQGSLLIKTTHS